MWKHLNDIENIDLRRLVAYSHELAIRILQSKLYDEDNDVKNFTDNIIDITLKEEV